MSCRMDVWSSKPLKQAPASTRGDTTMPGIRMPRVWNGVGSTQAWLAGGAQVMAGGGGASHGGGSDMIEEAAVLVVADNQYGFLPLGRVRREGLVHARQEGLAL